MGRFDRRTATTGSVTDAVDAFDRLLGDIPSSGIPRLMESGGVTTSGDIAVFRTITGRDVDTKLPSDFQHGSRAIVVNRGPGTVTVRLPTGTKFVNGSTTHVLSGANTSAEFIRISSTEFIQR